MCDGDVLFVWGAVTVIFFVMWMITWVEKSSLRRSHNALRKIHDDLSDLHWQTLTDYHRRFDDLNNRLAARQSTPEVPVQMYDTLIRLCHPDKHNGSEAATRATQWLLGRRPKRK